MTERELAACRKRLERYLADLLGQIGRTERRRWGEVYMRGLLLEGERKSIEPMAARLPDGNVQALQQFIGQSPWPYEPVRARLARRMAEELSLRAAWGVDDTGFPKQGKHSVGVARQYSGTLGKVGNCQVAVSLHLITDDASVPLDFMVYLPEAWTQDAARRRKAGIPAAAQFQPKWELALAMMDRVRKWGVASPQVILADTGYGHIAPFRAGLRHRELPYVVGVESNAGVWLAPAAIAPPPKRAGRGRPRTRQSYREPPRSVQEVAQTLPRPAWKIIRWREGSQGWLSSRFAAVRVWPSHGHTKGHAEEPESWLLIQWPADEPQPTKYWVSTLPADLPLRRLVRWAKSRWWIEQDYQQLKDELGLDHYEGRGWLGWHHHVTMALMAYDFLVLERLRQKKPYWVDPAEDAPGIAVSPGNMDRPVHGVRPTAPPPQV